MSLSVFFKLIKKFSFKEKLFIDNEHLMCLNRKNAFGKEETNELIKFNSAQIFLDVGSQH